MVLVITQETFNEAVEENINELGLSAEEAVEEAVMQFTLQGVDLSQIVKGVMTNPEDNDAVKDILNKLTELNKSKSPVDEITKQLTLLRTECDRGLNYRVLAGKAGAYDILLEALSSNTTDQLVVENCLKAMISLMSKQPDLLDSRGIDTMYSYFAKNIMDEHKRLALKWARECCILHETNRQDIFNRNIIPYLKEFLSDNNGDILKEALGLCRVIILDDDVRVEFGKSHEHARIIASETLCILTTLLTKFRTDEQLINDLILTLSALLVRAEFCKKVEDANGIQLISEVMKAFPQSQRINRQCFKLIKALCGDDHVKTSILSKGMAPIICSALDTHKGHIPTAAAGLSCVAALSLRSMENSGILFEAGIPEVIVSIMKLHSTDKTILKTSSWAVRNMVSRSNYQTKSFLDLGIEEILQKSLKNFKDIEYDIKSALRDLGCHIKFKEEWTGKGGRLNTQEKL